VDIFYHVCLVALDNTLAHHFHSAHDALQVSRKDGTRVLSMQEDIVVLGTGHSLNGVKQGIELATLGMSAQL
jgi:hypothetical protein